MLNITLTYKREDKYLKVIAWNLNIPVAEYYFATYKSPTPIGEALIKSTLLSWATIDLCFAATLTLDLPMSAATQKYILQHYHYVTKTYELLYKKNTAALNFQSKIDIIKMESLSLDRNSCYLGYSHGKDSHLCKVLLEKIKFFSQINHYKVSYDNNEWSRDGHINCNILTQDLYDLISITGIKGSSDIISSSQADDIHVTFVAPYIDLDKNTNKSGNLIVGLPWDAINSLEDNVAELVPTETYQSLQMLETLFSELNVEGFKIISPIASLHTYGVYYVLSQMISIKEIMQLESCWDAYLLNGNSCGTCPKCQRLKYIFKDAFGIDYLAWSPTLDITSADFLFSSISALQSIKKNIHIDFKKSCIIDQKTINLSGPFLNVLLENFNLIPLKSNLEVFFKQDEQTWSDLLKQVIKNIGMDYNKLSDMLCHSILVPYLPFEKHYAWDRRNKILNCYASFPVFNPYLQKWERIKVCNKGKKAKFPESDIFKHWLNLDVIRTQYKELYAIYQEHHEDSFDMLFSPAS